MMMVMTTCSLFMCKTDMVTLMIMITEVVALKTMTMMMFMTTCNLFMWMTVVVTVTTTQRREERRQIHPHSLIWKFFWLERWLSWWWWHWSWWWWWHWPHDDDHMRRQMHPHSLTLTLTLMASMMIMMIMMTLMTMIIMMHSLNRPLGENSSMRLILLFGCSRRISVMREEFPRRYTVLFKPA